jgi:hypothetical protein
MDNDKIVTNSSNPEGPNPHPNDNSSTSLAEPPFQKPDRDKLRALYSLTQTIRGKLVNYHGSMIKPGATTTYKENGNEVTRELTPRETMRHMKEIHKYSKLSLIQQKIDAGIEDDDTHPKSLNDLVTSGVKEAGDRMHQEALTQGLSCAAELPAARVDQIVQEEQAKYDAEHLKKPQPGHKKPFAIPPHLRNDWFVPAEMQMEIMTRLVDMALPDGTEYHEIKPRERLRASTLLSRFCALTQEQQLLDMQLHHKTRRDIDWDEWGKETRELIIKAVEADKRAEEEFYKTHPRGGRGRPRSQNTEVRL